MCTNARVEAKGVGFDGVVNDNTPGIPVLFSEKVDAGFPAAAPQIRGSGRQKMLAEHFQRPFVIPDDLGAVSMRNTNLDPGVFCTVQSVQPHGLVVGMDDFDRRVLRNDILNKAQILRIVQGVQAGTLKNASAHAADLVIIIAGFWPVDDKIKLDLFAVHMPVVIHKHRFDTGTVHIADRVQNADHRAFLLSWGFWLRTAETVVRNGTIARNCGFPARQRRITGRSGSARQVYQRTFSA